jgi:hypothetical protein
MQYGQYNQGPPRQGPGHPGQGQSQFGAMGGYTPAQMAQYAAAQQAQMGHHNMGNHHMGNPASHPGAHPGAHTAAHPGTHPMMSGYPQHSHQQYETPAPAKTSQHQSYDANTYNPHQPQNFGLENGVNSSLAGLLNNAPVQPAQRPVQPPQRIPQTNVTSVYGSSMSTQIKHPVSHAPVPS